MSLFQKPYEPFMTEYKKYNKKYVSKNFSHNLIMSQHAMLDIDAKNHLNNRHVCVLGDDDELEKYMLANILQANCNYVIPDTSGCLYELTGDFLRSQGYTVQVLDFAHPSENAQYNPLRNLSEHTEIDVLELSRILLQNGVDADFTDQDKHLLFSAIYYVLTLPKAQQTLSTVYTTLNKIYQEHDWATLNALVQYALKRISEKACQMWTIPQEESQLMHSLQRVVNSVSGFAYQHTESFTSNDTLSLDTIQQEKRALFIIDHLCYHEIQAILYTQILHQCMRAAGNSDSSGIQPLMIFLPKAIPELSRKLHLLHKHQTYVSFLYSSISSVKRDYPNDWNAVIGECDNLLYLGGKDFVTLEYMSQTLGYLPLDKKALRKRRLRHNSHINYQIVHREILTPEEVSKIPDDQCIVIVRNEKPFLDKKYVLRMHPNFQYLSDTTMRGYYEKF